MIRMFSRCDTCSNRDNCDDQSYYESRTCPNYR